jgi:membrane glycosyltransferase
MDTNTDRIEGYSWDGKTAIPAHPTSESTETTSWDWIDWIEKHGQRTLVGIAITAALSVATWYFLNWLESLAPAL